MIQTKTTTGWLFASGSSWPLRHTGGSRQDTHGTPVPEREGQWLAHNRRPQTNDRQTTTCLGQTCFQEKEVQTDVLSTKTGVDRHLYTYMVAELARRSHGDRAVKQSTRSRLVNRFEVEASRIIKKIVQRNGTITPDKINQVSWHETEHIKIRRISTRTKLLMFQLQFGGRSLRIKRHTEKSRRKRLNK